MLWNGKALEEFSTSRGIRQGDPISLYLFVLFIEKLFQLITVAVENNQWHPTQLARGGPRISHLTFADDVLLFAEASEDQVLLIKKVLDLFCRFSGLKVSDPKSRIFFSKNVNGVLKNHLCNISGFQVTDDIGKYLGVSIIHECVSKRSFNFIMEKVDKRLSNWKANTLSFAGRLTLTKSVIQALPTYVMQSTLIPRQLCEEIDKSCRRFLWGDTGEVRHLHSVSWAKICKPKAWGGLSLRSARNINQATLMKVAWDLTSRRDDLWVEVVRSKYKCGKDLMPNIDCNRAGSNLWRGICGAWKGVQQNLVWRISRGYSINVWNSLWIPEKGKIIDHARGLVNDNEAGLTVADLMNNEGAWDLEKIRHYLPDDILQFIFSINPPSTSRQYDRIAWKLSKDGDSPPLLRMSPY